MDAFELLKADHQKVAELFELLETASGKRKLDVFRRIKNELELHTHIEEAIFYPALEKPEPTHDLTLEAYEEHNVVKDLLAELSEASSANDEWQAKAKVLRENVEHHVKEEENELFDKADDVLTEEEIEALGERMAAEKARKLGQAPPKKASAGTNRKDKPKPGLISKIAEFVGLGNRADEKAAKKTAAKKTSSKKTSKQPAPSGAKKAAKSSGSKKQVRGSSKKQKATGSSRAAKKPKAGSRRKASKK
jgi:hemerythrin-like domain-containing protein